MQTTRTVVGMCLFCGCLRSTGGEKQPKNMGREGREIKRGSQPSVHSTGLSQAPVQPYFPFVLPAAQILGRCRLRIAPDKGGTAHYLFRKTGVNLFSLPEIPPTDPSRSPRKKNLLEQQAGYCEGGLASRAGSGWIQRDVGEGMILA